MVNPAYNALYSMLGIGISSYNRPDELLRLVSSIENHTTVPYRLWIVDGFSSQQTLRVLRNLESSGRAEVRYRDHWRGAGYDVFNDLLKIAQEYRGECPYFVRIDDDCVITKDGWDAEIIAALDSDPRVGLVSCEKCNVRFPLSPEGYVRQVKAEFMAIRSAIINEVGFFIERDANEEIIAYSMDSEWMERLGYYGWKIKLIEDVYDAPNCGTDKRIASFAGNKERAQAQIQKSVDLWHKIEVAKARFLSPEIMDNSLA